MPDAGLGADSTYEQITSELLLDGQARLNLATFVTTWMPSTAAKLMAETADKNMIDKDEYPQTAAIEARCVNMLADLWHAPEKDPATGCSTTGSSEAAMLAGMALKWRWRARREQQGKPADKPNLVMGVNVQVCWDKFCRYWEVEPRLVPMEGDRFHLDAETAVAHCDENTIGVVAILGSTFDGSYEPVAEIAAALDRYESDTGNYVPLHVDAASGGFVAPFVDPDLEWDFRLERVQSINASGHKYGLVYPGVGWAVWRSREALPKELVFDVNYLGGHMPTFALNFSRSGSQVIAQYYMFTSLGREGYTRVMQTARDVARHIADGVDALGPYNLISRGAELPVFAFATKPEIENYSVFDVSDRLRQRGWLVPAYTFPENRQDLSVLRIVVRPGMTHEMAELLLDHLAEQTEFLQSLDAPMPSQKRELRQAFSH
jgi:glutamate decarboxylase